MRFARFILLFLVLSSHIFLSTITHQNQLPKPFFFLVNAPLFALHSQYYSLIPLILYNIYIQYIYKVPSLSIWLLFALRSTWSHEPQMVPPTYAPPPSSFPFNLFSPSFPLMSHFEGFHNNNNTNNNSHHHQHHLFPLQDHDSTTTNQNSSTSKDLTLHDSAAVADKGWLRLSVGATTPDVVVHHHHHHHQQPPGFRLGLTELDLLPSDGVSKSNESSLGVVGNFSPSPALVLPPPPPAELNWTFRPISSHNSSSSNCSSSFIPFGPYFSTPFQLHPGLDLVAATAAAAGSSSDAVRVIDPPRRPHSGIWFSLQPLELNQ